MRLYLLGLSLLAGLATCQDTSQCTQDMTVRSMSPQFGGITAFYQIVKGISDGLQNTPNDETYKNINTLIFGPTGPQGDNPDVTTWTVINDVIRSQIGAIIFWSISFVFMLAAIVLLIVTASCQCCSSCTPSEKSERSTVLGIVYVVLLVSCFAFILTGTILFNISASNLFSSIDQANTYTDQITSDIGHVITSGTAELTCAVNSTATGTIDAIQMQLGSYSDDLITNTSQQTGLTALQTDSDIARTQNDATIQLGTTALASLGAVIVCNTDALKNLITQSQTQLQSYDAADDLLNTQVEAINVNLNNIKAQIDEQTTMVNESLTQAQTSINTATADISSGLNSTLSEIMTLVNAIISAQNDIETWPQYSTVQSGVRALVSTPAAVALFFALLATLAIIYVLIVRENAKKIARVSSIVTIVGFYIVLVLSFLALTAASASFLLGWGMSAACVPIFQDPTYRFFRIVNDNISISHGQNTVNVNLGDVLQNCSSPDTTFYAAIDGSQIFSPNTITNQLNLQQYQYQINNYIVANQVQFDLGGTSTTLQAITDALNKALTQLQDMSNNILMNCDQNNQDVKKAQNDVKAYIASLKTTTQSLMTVNTDLAYSMNSNVTAILLNQNNNGFNQANTTIDNSTLVMTDQLQNQVFHCKPLVDVFQNSGDVICKQFGEPIHGIWGASGLAGIMFFPLALLLLFSFRWLRTRGAIEDDEGYRPTGNIGVIGSNAFHDKWNSESPKTSQPMLQRSDPYYADGHDNRAYEENNSPIATQRIPRLQAQPVHDLQPYEYNEGTFNEGTWSSNNIDSTTNRRGLKRM